MSFGSSPARRIRRSDTVGFTVYDSVMARQPADFFESLDDAKFDALVETMFLSEDADGDIVPDEELTLVLALTALADTKGYEADFRANALSTRFARLRELVASEGRQARIDSVCKRLSSVNERRGALALAVKVAAADGIIRTSERELLLELAEGLGLPSSDAADLVAEFSAPARG